MSKFNSSLIIFFLSLSQHIYTFLKVFVDNIFLPTLTVKSNDYTDKLTQRAPSW